MEKKRKMNTIRGEETRMNTIRGEETDNEHNT